ncbi:MAG: hypothetical protein AAFX00_14195 [Pseudomonadota bacterium]
MRHSGALARAIAVIAALGIGLALSGCTRIAPEPAAERLFREMVLQAMPNYDLTAEIYGRPVVQAEYFAMTTPILAIGADEGPEPGFARLLSKLDEGGVRPFVLIANEPGFPNVAWRIDFPGCTPGTCSDEPDPSWFRRLSDDEARTYLLYGFEPNKRYNILDATIDGVSYHAYAQIITDARGRVMLYFVRLTREPSTDGEVAWAARFRKSESHPIIFHYYARNLVLGNDEEVAEPDFFGLTNRSVGL